ncbi:LacI family DNA-binding transcriptional regulator [Rubrivirga sp.]|uniref:LacI family DNA-binding transcriptional regulator n=1 Tax=Rubrivirga sp. TaxID=1885344 RepID=UPI003B5271A6
MPDRVTITDVAAQAGVSISTVSLVMNGKGAVAEATRSRVQTAATRLGYTPSRTARGLAAGRTGNLGFVLREDHFRQSEPFYTRVFLGAEFEARRRGLYVLLATVPERYDASHAPRFLSEHSVDGIVVAGRVDGDFLDALGRSGLPYVLADYARDGAPSVQVDNEGGAALVAAHLVERGHTRAAFLGADRDHPSLAARCSAFVASMAAAGHAVADAHVVTDDGAADRTAGARLGAHLLDGPDRPRAVFCGNDALALGLLDAARDRGLDVPSDLAVVGFDDVEGAALAAPPLTTVRVCKEQLGEVALGVLAERAVPVGPVAARFDRASSVTQIATDLVVRASS